MGEEMSKCRVWDFKEIRFKCGCWYVMTQEPPTLAEFDFDGKLCPAHKHMQIFDGAELGKWKLVENEGCRVFTIWKYGYLEFAQRFPEPSQFVKELKNTIDDWQNKEIYNAFEVVWSKEK